MKLNLRNISLPLRHTFTIAHGSTSVQKNLLVELEDQGVTGYGEGASLAYYGITVANMREALEGARSRIEIETLGDPTALWDRLLPLLGHNRFALCALDQAAHDLWGKQLGKPVHALWGLSLENLPASDYTIGIDTIDKMVAKMREFDGWPIYKIKLGTAEDLQIVRALRQETSAVFRVDANCAWTAEQTIRNAVELKSLGVEFIEQPLSADDWDGMKQVFAHSDLPVIADESCLVEEDVDLCHGHFHGINVKLTKAGGMTPAKRMLTRARELGMRCMVGCMNESSVGISAIGQLLPMLDYVDMDGALLIARDIATGVRLEKGRAVFPNVPGNGVTLMSAQ
jgi:L-alanine-DL-glutamate epimerase-like enolase superfamily enzyme